MSNLEKPPVGWNNSTHSRSSSTASSRHSRQNSKDWEVMDDLQTDMFSGTESPADKTVPGICEGYLMKRRKRPLKGWHKRYFVLEKGFLKYAKTPQDIARGKLHGALDVSLAVMLINQKSLRIDLDAGDNLYHMKAENQDLFYIWVTKLGAHRVFKKNEAVHLHNGFLQALTQGGDVLPSAASLMQRNGAFADPSYARYKSMESTLNEAAPPVAELSHASGTANTKVSAWLQQTQDIDSCSQELSRCQSDLTELNQLVQKLQALERGVPPFSNDELQRIISMQNLNLEKPKKKSNKTHSRTLSRFEGLGMLSSSHLSSSSHLGASVPSIPQYLQSQLSTPCSTSPEARKTQQDICTLSQKVHTSLKSVLDTLVAENQRLKEAFSSPDLRKSTSRQLASLCTTLSELEMQSRLTQVHSLSVSSDSSDESQSTVRPEQQGPFSSIRRSKRHTCRRAPSMAESTSEYFDASETFVCDSSSDESGVSDDTTSTSEPEEQLARTRATLKYRASISAAPDTTARLPKDTGRRTTLPAPGPDNSHIGLMTILYNNIGKDLSRVSMPIPLNEPVCLLQRLCEELEYSDLLDTASQTEDPYQRMVYIAAFAISGYANARYRNRYKPFNPVLGETFECIREDRGFHYISEQVSHHPPISACHAEAENFSFWQDQRWKNKFWGKSLEIMPTGMVNVTLPKFNDHYEWNKVVTCIHNVLSQQRYLEHYGEVTIRNLNSSVCICKITFVKSRYWSSDNNMNEVQGTVLDEAGNVVHQFGGLWHEGIYCDTLPTPQCVWKPTPQPNEHFKYYGFSRFAMEMNELTPELLPLLPPTDTRLRPDQRMLEEGQVEAAEKKKDEVENKQRDRRKEMAKKGEEHIPRFFRKTIDAAGREVWITNRTYWKLREDPGFANMTNLDLW
ncbi:hypothetical protein GJAV_G00152180 [Gymnothorax javanicus]|nr:hypothetical protein GJAV_G00152180 [Gymnothorax javanicus]